MIDNIPFDDTDKTVTVKIDNEEQNIPIKKIRRLPTTIDVIGILDTALYNPIDVNLLLYCQLDETFEFRRYIERYVEDQMTITDEEAEQMLSIVEDGFINLSITNLDKSITYDSQKVPFKNGKIQTQMIDTLPLGEYILYAEYDGNKYYEGSSLTIQFMVTKRMAECQIHDNTMGGYPNENINITATFSDVLTKRTIKNCTVTYNFNGNQYITQTDEYGLATLNFSMPDVDTESCAMNIITNDPEIAIDVIDNPEIDVYWAEDGNIRFVNNRFEFIQDADDTIEEEDTYYVLATEEEEEEKIEEEEENIVIKQMAYVYQLSINIDSDYYNMEDENIYLAISKYNTKIIGYITQQENSFVFDGDVIITNDNIFDNVRYGTINLYISDVEYQQNVSIDETGHFEFEILYSDISQPISSNVLPQEAINYSPKYQTTTKIMNENNQTFHTGDTIQYNAQIINAYTNQPVKAGMVTFIIATANTEVYRYVTELNDNGIASLHFDLSTTGNYTIQALYHPMLNFEASESTKLNYTVN